MKHIHTVLVIDSDKTAVFILQHQLRQMGYQADIKHIGIPAMALEYIASAEPDLVFVDPLPADDYKTFLDELLATGLFEKTMVCLLTNYPLIDDGLFAGYPFRLRFKKPFTKQYMDELSLLCSFD